MSRLPARFQRWWPLLKRGHRILALLTGVLFRVFSPLLGRRGLPRWATTSSLRTAAGEPDAVAVHPGGGPEELRRRLPPGEPAGHPTFRAAEEETVPQRYVLEVRDGLLCGDFGATVTPGKVLDYQTSGYFGIDGWREHPLFLRPTVGRVEHVPGTVLSLVTRGTVGNYYHFLYDAIARLGIVEECLPDERYDTVVVAHRSRYQQELLALAGVTAKLVQPEPGRTWRADRLLVPSTPNQDLVAPPSTVRWLRARLPSSPATDLPRRIYLTRGDVPNTRRYVQESVLRPLLKARGFVVVDPGTLSVQEQIDLFSSAEVVVAPHGAGLTNITFCRPGTRVLELFAPSYVHLGLWTIAEAVGLDYRYLVGERPPGGASSANPYEDVSISAARVLAAVDDLLS